MASSLSNLSVSVGSSEFRQNTANALNWLHEKYQLLIGTKLNRKRILEESPNVPRPFIGRMYMFRYLPKTRQKLPYYDMCPLVIPIEAYGANEMLGINFHYLPYRMRTKLMSHMLEKVDFVREGNEHFNFQYKHIKGVARYRNAIPCIHRYDLTKVTSKLIKIAADDWMTALYLPVEQFVKQDKRYVWGQSRKMVQGMQGG